MPRQEIGGLGKSGWPGVTRGEYHGGHRGSVPDDDDSFAGLDSVTDLGDVVPQLSVASGRRLASRTLLAMFGLDWLSNGTEISWSRLQPWDCRWPRLPSIRTRVPTWEGT